MCGIGGIWGQDPSSRVEAMVAAMHHRGPDDSGIYRDSTVSLGMSRLAIIDVGPRGHQPMHNSERTIWTVYNGEIYNFRSERALLESRGYSFSSASDTEVLLRMYEHYGDDFVCRLRGIFAFAIYDRRRGPGRERLLLARDHFGIKPLLFSRSGASLVFGSEIKALLASGLVTPEIDPVAVRLLLTFGSVSQPRTILRDVQMLLPAHRLIMEGGRERIERYWSLGLNRLPDLRREPYELQVKHLAAVLEESVRLQMVSDVPLGAFLSGGIDSSLLVAMMSTAAGHRVRTFSVGFEAEGDQIDESREAERTARFLGTDHARVMVRGKDVQDRIEHIAYSLDQPSVDGVNAYFVSLAARRGVTVAISGTGGDELFAGYPWFIGMVLNEARKRREPWKAAGHRLLAGIARHRVFDAFLLPPDRRGAWRVARAREGPDFLSAYAREYHIFGALGAGRLLSRGLREAAQAGRAPYYDLLPTDELAHGSVIDRVTGLCQRGYTTNQLLRDIDAVSMAHSLEVRVPFLDPIVADVALSLPDSAKIGAPERLSRRVGDSYRTSGAKRILVDLSRSLLPEDFDLRPKRGFTMPFGAWLRGPLREVLMDALSENQLKARGLLDVQQAVAVRESFLAGADGWVQPWLLMMLELWFREVLDRAPSALAEGSRWRGPRLVCDADHESVKNGDR